MFFQDILQIKVIVYLIVKFGCYLILQGEKTLAVDKCDKHYYNNPRCMDHPDGYGCECGPGFHWNTEQCMSSVVDSTFEFKPNEPIRYTLLLEKSFPELSAFTICFWIKIRKKEHGGTIFSYKADNKINILRMNSGPTLNFEIKNHKVLTDIRLIRNRWYHIGLTWSYRNGIWNLYINGSPIKRGKISSRSGIPSGGEFVLGQSSRPDVKFNSSEALDGDLSQVNIWNYVMEKDKIQNINSSCTFMYCGNAVEWVNFRSGTRGAMKMRWPSGIFTGECFSKTQSAVSCDKFCSDLEGAQCNEETEENIKWTRQAAKQNITVECPSYHDADRLENETISRFATRSCVLRKNDNDGEWQQAYIDDCISADLLQLKKLFLELHEGAVNEISVLQLADQLLNHTQFNIYYNPIDVATVIDMLQILVQTQSIAPRTVRWKTGGQLYARTDEVYPTFKQTQTFCELLVNIVNNLLAPRNEAGWNATRPSGSEGDKLMQVMKEFSDVISRSLDYHIRDALITYQSATLNIVREHIEFKIETQWAEDLHSMEFPEKAMLDKHGNPSKDSGFLKINKETLISTNASEYTVFLGISMFRYKTLSRMLPTEELPIRGKEDRVNTPIVSLYIHMGNAGQSSNFTSPVIISLPILDSFNISNPECVRLSHGKRRKKWRWISDSCYMLKYKTIRGICACTKPGVYAITTDMYDVNWDKGDKRPQLMNFASYFGCTMSATLCLIVCGVHTYLRTSTSTAALHRNLSVSIALSQLVFMFGIDRYDTPAVCQTFAILLHYFFLATYSWVMNEAFNLYIVITYSAHNPTDLNDSGSMIRYYVLGWVLPGILVGAFVGTSDDYYANDMCWIATDHIWLFIGPAIGITCITILVLIFTAKEHNENSYTKTDKTNKIINIHMKALWTQVILVTVCWAFAFISITLVDTILKYLYALFTSLQGAFFVVFYMFLHEEVRAWIKSRQKRRALQLQGFEFQDDHSMDSFASNSLIERDAMDSQSAGTLTVGGGSGSAGGNGSFIRMTSSREPKTTRVQDILRTKNKSKIEASSDEGSDCEMMSSL